MFEGINIDEFFSKTREILDSKEEVLAVTIITPTQTVHARLDDKSEQYLNTDYKVVHEDIFDYCLGKLYGVGKGIDVTCVVGRDIKRKELGVMITNRVKNFINVSYIFHESILMAVLTIPSFVTRYQFDELVKLNEKIKFFGFDIHVGITDYNPVLVSKDSRFQMQFFEDKENISLDLALNYLAVNGRIVDYDSPFGEEIPFYEEKLEKIA